MPNVQGGVEKHCEELYPRLVAPVARPASSHSGCAWKITVFRRRAYVHDSDKQWNHIDFIDLPSTRIKGFETVFHSLLCAIVCIFRRPDVVHVHNIGPGVFIPLLRVFGLKTVLTYHSANYEHAKWNFWQKRIIRVCERFALKFSNGIIFVSRSQRDKFPKYHGKSYWIPNGVGKPVRSNSAEYVESLGLKPGQYVLAVGRITEEKGFDCLIEAWKKTDHQPFRLVIAGGSDHATPFVKRLTRQAEENHVVMAGFVTGEKLNPLYSHARLFVLPSYNEGLPLALLEAMSYSLPVLAGDITPNLDIGLPEDCYFRTGNAEDLAVRLKDRLKNEPTVVPWSLDHYDWDSVAEQTSSVYTALIPPGARDRESG